MRTHTAFTLFILISVAILALPTGCGSDSGDPDNSASTGGGDDPAGDDAASAADGGATSGDQDADEAADDAGPAEEDTASHTQGPDGNDAPVEPGCTPEESAMLLGMNLDEIMGSCAETCMSPDNTESQVQSCAADCVKTATGIEESCSACFGNFLLCTMTSCSMVSEDPSAPAPPCPDNPAACGACVQSNCEPDLAVCIGAPDSSGPGDGNCTNDEDMAILDESLDTMLDTCGADCLDAANPGACMEGCTIDLDISDMCGECFYKYGECVTESCDVCSPDTVNDADCQSCMQTSCGPAFLDCSGLDFFSEEPACVSDEDMELLGPGEELTNMCSGQCMSGGEEVEACMTDCLAEAGLSDDCSACISSYTMCVSTDCKDQCTGDAGSDEECGLCIEEKCSDVMTSCVGTGGGGGNTGPGPGPEDGGICGGETDAAVLNANDTLSQDCAMGCALEPNPGVCITECLQAAGLSTACSGCVTAVLGCGFDNCGDICMDDSQEAACNECVAANCSEEEAACFGDSGGGGTNPPGPDPGDDTVCSNPSDSALFNTNPPPEEGCAMECWLVPDREPCLTQCLITAGITDSCSACMAALMMCIFDECEVCTSMEPDDAGCDACITAQCSEQSDACWPPMIP